MRELNRLLRRLDVLLKKEGTDGLYYDARGLVILRTLPSFEKAWRSSGRDPVLFEEAYVREMLSLFFHEIGHSWQMRCPKEAFADWFERVRGPK